MTYLNVQNIRDMFADKLNRKSFKIDKSGCKMLEIVGQSFVATEPILYGTENLGYIERELEWYKSESLSVHDIPGKCPQIWMAVSDDNGNINSNYGWCIFSSENNNQYMKVLSTLSNDINSRQAVMIYTRPTMHEDAFANGMHDFMCTAGVQYIWNQNTEELDAVVNMRSNDAVFGYKNDFAWQQFVLEDLCEDLDVTPGIIHWQTGSIHVYEKHFKYVETYD